MADLTPHTWITAGIGVIGTMQHWKDIKRQPTIAPGTPNGDLSDCGCESGDQHGTVLVSAGPVFWVGDQFPNPDTQRRSIARSCPDEWAVLVTVEFARCRPTFAADGRSKPSVATRTEFAEKLYADAWAIWNALRCAQAPWRSQLGAVLVGGWGPIERDLGPCGGFEFTYTGKVTPCVECP